MSKEPADRKKGGCLKSVLIAIVVFVALGAVFGGSKDDTKPVDTPPAQKQQSTSTPEASPAPVAPETPEAPEKPAEPEPETPAKPEPEPKPEVQPAPAPAEEVKNPLLSATFSLDEVKSGIGNNVLGQYGYIKIDKKDLKTVTNEQFTEFAEQKVQDSGLNWVSIICDDGTGICFAGSISYVAEYGEVDTDGAILKSAGVIMLTDSGYTYEQTT